MNTTNSELLDQMPPCDLDAEKALLASILIDSDKLDDVTTTVRSDDFYSRQHGELFRQIVTIQQDRVGALDATLLHSHLKKQGKLEAVGGFPYIIELFDVRPTTANAIHYADIVRGHATQRALIGAGQRVLQLGYDRRGEPREQLAEAEKAIFGILDERTSGGVRHVADVLHEAMEEIDRRCKARSAIGLKTEFPDLDSLTGGMAAGDLVILAARPGMGKTALAGSIAENITFKGKTVCMFSLEMNGIELADRMLCSVSKIDSHRLRAGILDASERRVLVESMAKLSCAPLHIDDGTALGMTEIAAKCRRMKRRGELDLVIVDYLQLVKPDNPRDVREQQVAQIVRRMKGMARELKIPVLCLAQLNRQTESGGNTRPKLSHLRESGSIEQDADQVWFVHRKDYYAEKKDQLDHKAEIIVAKNRKGRTGVATLAFFDHCTRFESVASQERYGDFDEWNGGQFV